MVVIDGKKFACSTCIKDHRSSSCDHLDRALFAIREKGRLVLHCEHCGEVRKAKQVHVKCECDTKPSASATLDPEGQPVVARKGIYKVETLETQRPVFPNGITDMEEVKRRLAQLMANEAAAHEPGCTCKDGGSCSCCTERYIPKHARGDSSTSGPSSAQPGHASRPSIPLTIPLSTDDPSSPPHSTTSTHARGGSHSHSRSPSRSTDMPHNATEGHIIGSSSNNHQQHAVHYSSYPTSAVNGAYNQSPSSSTTPSSGLTGFSEGSLQHLQNGAANLTSPSSRELDARHSMSLYATKRQHSSDIQLDEIVPEFPGEIVKPPKPVLRGGYADVFRGTWTRPDGEQVDVAIKVLRAAVPTSMSLSQEKLKKKFLTRMRREILIWTRMTHRHIHPFLGYRLGDEPQLISPWCTQGNLSDYLSNNPNISRSRKLRLIHQTALGIAYLHSQRPPICHGDIKPENVLINDSIEAALSDFGVSRILGELPVHTGLTTSGGPKGTYAYTAPEVFNPELLGPGHVEPKLSCEGDVYAFGGLILGVMSGQRPFHKFSSPLKIMSLIVGNVHPHPCDHAGLPDTDSLWDLMKRCWHIKASERPSMKKVTPQLQGEIDCWEELENAYPAYRNSLELVKSRL